MLDEIGLRYALDDFGKGKKYVGGDKTSLGLGFTIHYEKLFNDIKEQKLMVLELGVFHGKSLAMWCDYFPNSMIHGIDINLSYFNEQKLRKLGAFSKDNFKLIQVDITSKDFIDIVQSLNNFNIIIDDANHKADVQYNNFILLFDKVVSGGYYIIEDIVEPDKFYSNFKDIIIGSISDKSKSKYKNKISNIEIHENLFIIKKK